MKKIIIVSMIAALLFCLFLSPAMGAEYYNSKLDNADAKAYMTVNADYSQTIFAKNENEQLPCTSLTKIMTMIVAAEKIKDFNKSVTVTQNEIDELANTNAYTFGLNAGDNIYIIDLMYLTLLNSANDAAIVLANAASGSTEQFVSDMNAKASELGCSQTQFTDPTGISDNDVSSASDLIKISEEFMSDSLLSKISSTYEYSLVSPGIDVDDRQITNDFRMVDTDSTNYYYRYASGIKNGYSEAAKSCACITATKNGYTYYTVILGCEPDDTGYSGASLTLGENMFDWVFDNIELRVVADPNQYIAEAKVKLSSETDYVAAVPAKQVMALLLKTVDESSLTYDAKIDDDLKAPIHKGDKIGTATVKFADEDIAQIDLVASDDIKANVFLSIGYGIKTIVTSSYFIAGVVVLFLLIISAVFVRSVRSKQKIKSLNSDKKDKPGERDRRN